MSTQSGPNWYPSKQFVHSPPPPLGAPANPKQDPPLPGLLAETEPKVNEPTVLGVFRRILDKMLRRGRKTGGA